jgi:hypothetical protein
MCCLGKWKRVPWFFNVPIILYHDQIAKYIRKLVELSQLAWCLCPNGLISWLEGGIYIEFPMLGGKFLIHSQFFGLSCVEK